MAKLPLYVLVPAALGYWVAGMFWDLIRLLNTIVWYFEDYLIPERYQKQELDVLAWLCKWPSLFTFEMWLDARR